MFASQDPVAIDSVAFDFLRTEWTSYPHMSGTDDYLKKYVFSVNNFKEYLELCGGKERLDYLKRREFLKEPMRAPWRKEG